MTDLDDDQQEYFEGEGRSIGDAVHVVSLSYQGYIEWFDPILAVASIKNTFKSPEEFILKRIEEDWSKDDSFKLLIKPMQIELENETAVYTSISWTAYYDGVPEKSTLDYWVVQRLDKLLIFSYVATSVEFGEEYYNELSKIRGEVINIVNTVKFKNVNTTQKVSTKD